MKRVSGEPWDVARRRVTERARYVFGGRGWLARGPGRSDSRVERGSVAPGPSIGDGRRWGGAVSFLWVDAAAFDGRGAPPARCVSSERVGVRKSTVARRLAKALGVACRRADRIEQSLRDLQDGPGGGEGYALSPGRRRQRELGPLGRGGPVHERTHSAPVAVGVDGEWGGASRSRDRLPRSRGPSSAVRVAIGRCPRGLRERRAVISRAYVKAGGRHRPGREGSRQGGPWTP